MREQKHLLYGVRVLLAREPVDHPWLKHRWRLVDMVLKSPIPGDGSMPAKGAAVVPMRAAGSEASVSERSARRDKQNNDDKDGDIFIAETAIDLHRAEAEAYAENLASSDPSIYVVLRDDVAEAEESIAGIRLVEVSLSPYHIQDYEDCGEDLIMKMPLAGSVRELLQGFVEQHYKPEAFKKRQRDRLDPDTVFATRGDARLDSAYAAPNNPASGKPKLH